MPPKQNNKIRNRMIWSDKNIDPVFKRPIVNLYKDAIQSETKFRLYPVLNNNYIMTITNNYGCYTIILSLI